MDRFLLIRMPTGTVVAVVVGGDVETDHEIVPVTAELAHVGRGWVRQVDGTFVDPFAAVVVLDEVVPEVPA